MLFHWGSHTPQIKLNLTRFISGDVKKSHKGENITRLLKITRTLVDQLPADPANNPPTEWRQKLSSLEARVAADEESVITQKANGDGTAQKQSPNSDDFDALFRIMADHLRIERSQMLAVQNSFFTAKEIASLETGAEQRVYRHFDTYRLHSKKGFIVKSFTAITLAKLGVGNVCFFANFYRGDYIDGEPSQTGHSDVREARGILIPTRRVLYLLGEIHGGNGLKILAIDDPGAPRTKFSGLLMSFDNTNNPITCRFVMKESAHDHSSLAGIGIYRETQLRRELADDIEKLKPPPSPTLPMYLETERSPRRANTRNGQSKPRSHAKRSRNAPR